MVILNSEVFQNYNGSKWVRVFYHYNANGAHGFTNEDEAKHCVSDSYKFSILDEITSGQQINGKYEFIIEYPELGTYNRWRQTNNPLEEQESSGVYKVEGFEELETLAPYSSWGGLVYTSIYESRSSPPSLLNGNPGRKEWYYAIGQYEGVTWIYYSKTYSSIPSSLGVAVNYVSLWLRLPDKSFTCICKTTNGRFIAIILNFIIINKE